MVQNEVFLATVCPLCEMEKVVPPPCKGFAAEVFALVGVAPRYKVCQDTIPLVT